MKTELCGAANVQKDAFQQRQMTVPWVVHVETRPLDRVGNVRARDGQVLKGARQAAIELGVEHWWTVRHGELALGIEGRTDRLAVRHPSTVEDVLGIPGLRQEEAPFVALEVDAEEEAQITHVLDGELGIEPADDVLKE